MSSAAASWQLIIMTIMTHYVATPRLQTALLLLVSAVATATAGAIGGTAVVLKALQAATPAGPCVWCHAAKVCATTSDIWPTMHSAQRMIGALANCPQRVAMYSFTTGCSHSSRDGSTTQAGQ
jgi:hypothetical protein